MSDPIKKDKVKVVAVRAADPEIIVDIDLQGSNFSRPEDSLIGSIVLYPPSNASPVINSAFTTTYNGNDSCVLTIQLPSFGQNSSLPGTMSIVVIDSNGNQSQGFTKDFVLVIPAVPVGSNIEVNVAFMPLVK